MNGIQKMTIKRATTIQRRWQIRKKVVNLRYNGFFIASTFSYHFISFVCLYICSLDRLHLAWNCFVCGVVKEYKRNALVSMSAFAYTTLLLYACFWVKLMVCASIAQYNNRTIELYCAHGSTYFETINTQWNKYRVRFSSVNRYFFSISIFSISYCCCCHSCVCVCVRVSSCDFAK